MSEVFNCAEPSQLLAGTRLARQAVARGELVVLPTDTVYGLAADAFSAAAVQKLLDAKGRGRQSPPPVLIPDLQTLRALAADAHAALCQLAEKFWPGALTMVVTANPALDWDLGDTGGTVALRMPDSDLSCELLRETGPLAVSSANLAGEKPALTIAEAQQMLGESVAVYLAGAEVSGAPSTIIDVTKLDAAGSGTVTVLREGAIPATEIAQALPLATIE